MSLLAIVAVALAVLIALDYLKRIAHSAETAVKLLADEAAVREHDRAQRDRLAEELRGGAKRAAR